MELSRLLGIVRRFHFRFGHRIGLLHQRRVCRLCHRFFCGGNGSIRISDCLVRGILAAARASAAACSACSTVAAASRTAFQLPQRLIQGRQEDEHTEPGGVQAEEPDALMPMATPGV